MESSTPPNSKTESISGSPPATNGPQGNIAGIGLGSSQEGAVIQEVVVLHYCLQMSTFFFHFD